ncbi:MAG: hypothetical protein HOQ02_11610 [Lysobacter sp.]|nr:hypothetical protein [Lysobacter sp.]
MNEVNGNAVFFHDNALESLGDALAPYLRDSPRGRHVQCEEIDTGGAFIEMLLKRANREGKWTEIELMVPAGAIRMIVSCQSDGTFGFGPRETEPAPISRLPPVGPTGEPPAARPEAVPDGTRLPATAADRQPPTK